MVTPTTDNSKQEIKHLIHPAISLAQWTPVEPDREKGAMKVTHNLITPPGQKVRKELDTKQGAKTKTRSSLGMTAQTAKAAQETVHTSMIQAMPSILKYLQMVANPLSHGIMMAKLSLRYQATEPSSCKAAAPSLRWQLALRQHSKDKSSKSHRWETLS